MTISKPNQFIKIGESLHASVARCGEAMLKDYKYRCAQSLEYIINLIKEQAVCGADFIEVNVDKFDSDCGKAMMERYVGLVGEHGEGIPVCIDSSSDELLECGLKAWYSQENRKKPLLNSIKPANADKFFNLSKDYPFAFIGLLMSQTASVEQITTQSREIFDKAINCGFQACDIYFDTCAFGLATDMPLEPSQPSRTFAAFEAIKAIKADEKMAGVHLCLGVSNCTRNLPARRSDVIAAYLAKAIDYGLDAAIIDVRRDWFSIKADPKLLELVSSFAQMDGSADKFAANCELMSKFCSDCRSDKEAK